MNAQITTALLVLGVVQLSRKLDLEDPTIINAVRVAYFTSQLLILAVLYFVKTKIEANPNNTIIEYEDAAPSFSQPTGGQKKRVTVQEYDLTEWKNQFKQTLIPLAIITGLHLYAGFTQPLIIQTLLPWKNLYSTPIVQIYLLGKPAEGANARPFKKPNPFEGLIPTSPAPTQEPPQQEAITSEQTETDTNNTTTATPSSPSSSDKPKTRKRNVPRDT